MSPFAATVLVLAGIVQCANGLVGSNVCFEKQNYSLTTRVKYQQPVSVRTYSWCFDFPPKCSTVHTEMRDMWKVQTVQQTKTVEVCCEGFKEEEDRCRPKCPEGFTGNKCDQDCPSDRWGTSCHQECRCPENSNCDGLNGKCICLDGWLGSSCNVPIDSITTATPIQIIGSSKNGIKILFDWSTPLHAPTEHPKHLSNSITDTIFNQPDTNTVTTTLIIDNRTSEKTITKHVTVDRTTEVNKTKDKTMIKHVTTDGTTEVNKTSEKTITKHVTVDETTKANIIKSTPVPKTTRLIHLVTIAPSFITTDSQYTTKSTTELSNSTRMISIANKRPEIKSTTQRMNISAVEISKPNNKTQIGNATSLVKDVTISQIERPESTDVFLITTNSPTMFTTQNVTKIVHTTDLRSKTESPFTILKTTISTAKRKHSKMYKVESDILNITLHSAGNINETNSRIFKTVTSPTIHNSTRKLLPPKGKYLHESKMITIPVRIIMDTGREQAVFNKKYNQANEATTEKPNIFIKKLKSQGRTVSPMTNTTFSNIILADEQTEEVKHVLTEPEQITSVAGSEDSDEKRSDLFSVLSIAAGVAVAMILTTSIIALVARCRQGRKERAKHIEMEHVQSMMNVSEDDMQSGYLRNVFHSPLPDPPYLQNVDKTRFAVPFMQPVVIHAISPSMIENFRDILECHYDHPKPPRPTSFSVMSRSSTYDLPPSRYSNVNTLPRISESSNHSNGSDTKTEICFPVTDAAINVLKLEHQNAQHHALDMENLEPVYDEIPCWHTAPVCGSLDGDEAVTEL